MTHYWFISTRYRHGTKLALVTFIFAFVVILLGAYTRLTNAGLSCPDWPHCYGFVTAPHTPQQLFDAAQKFPLSPVNIKKAWTEMTHRYMAGLEGVLILILSISIFRRRPKNLPLLYIAAGLIALLTAQILLGMFTVTVKLKPIIVLLHLLTGLSILSTLWVIYLNAYTFNSRTRHEIFPAKTSRSLQRAWFWVPVIIVAMQITLGGWTSTHYAGLACIDFPYCQGKLLPALRLDEFNSNLITIHMLHRIGAAVTAIYLSLFALFLMTKPFFKSIAWLLFILIMLQMTFGILNIVWLRPIWVALFHQATAIFLLLTTITALVKTYFDSTDTYCHGS